HVGPIAKPRAEAPTGPVKRPAHAALDKILKPRIAPRAFIMPPRGVENAPLAVRAHPSPRLLVAVFKHRAVLLIVLGMDVGFIDALEGLEPLHDWVVRLRNGRANGAGAVRFELS